MKDIVIISIYEYGSIFKVMVDGIVYSMRREKKTIADVLYDIYNAFGWESREEFKKMFPDKKIIICEDGDIEVL